jgi:hypothetical protein
MAFTEVSPLEATRFIDVEANATAEDLSDSANTIYAVEVDNTGNTVDVFVKLYDAATVTVGTTTPNIIIKCKAGSTRKVAIHSSSANQQAPGNGYPFATGLLVACVTEGGTGGTTSPTNKVRVSLFTD